MSVWQSATLPVADAAGVDVSSSYLNRWNWYLSCCQVLLQELLVTPAWQHVLCYVRDEPQAPFSSLEYAAIGWRTLL
jgi:hypothetical protein